MRTTNEILDAACKKLGNVTDYRLAITLEADRARISGWRKKKSQPNNEMVYRLATLLEEDPALILAEIEADFAKTPEHARYWLNFLRCGRPQERQRSPSSGLPTGWSTSGAGGAEGAGDGGPHKMRLCYIAGARTIAQILARVRTRLTAGKSSTAACG